MTDDGAPLTADDVEAAASVGRLPALARQLVVDGSWSSLDVVLRYARDTGLPLGELEETVRALDDAIVALPEGRRSAASDEVHALRRQAAFTLLKRLDRDPLTGPERNALGAAGAILAGLGELERAARIFERAGDDGRAAEAYGALGDLDRMEACLAREEQRRRRRQTVADAVRRFEALLQAGERRAALAAAAAIPEDDFEGSGARATAAGVERRLCRGRSVTLRLPGGESATFAATPATLGRDGLCELALRDPSVSRRHARIAADGEALAIEDLDSRGGTRLAGAQVRARLPLPPQGELALGDRCLIRFQLAAAGILEVTGGTGLDRGLRAFVGAGPLPVSLLSPEAKGLTLRLELDACRLERPPELVVRIDGRLIGPGCDLLHGETLELERPRLRLEVL